MKRFRTTDFNNQLERSLGKCTVNFAEVGECFEVAERIEDGDLQSWHDEWFGLAERLYKQAENCRAKGRTVSARNLYFRACEYYRQATFFHRVDLDCSELQEGWRAHAAAFRLGSEMLDYEYEPIEIPFEGKKMFGYIFFQDRSGKSHPLIIAPSGFDGTAEEMLASIGLPALERGYSVLLFDAPGQGRTLYDSSTRLHMRPDFEVPLKAVVDYAVSRKEIVINKIAAYGLSLGGYLVPRGATGEKRLSALIADPGQCDIGITMRKMLPAELLESLNDDSSESEALFSKLISTLDGKLKILPRMSALGASSPREFFLLSMEYRSTPELLKQINCPCLICDNETDVITSGQGEMLAQHLECPYEFVRFTNAEGAGGHCQTMGKQIFFQKAFDWLDEQVH